MPKKINPQNNSEKICFFFGFMTYLGPLCHQDAMSKPNNPAQRVTDREATKRKHLKNICRGDKKIQAVPKRLWLYMYTVYIYSINILYIYIFYTPHRILSILYTSVYSWILSPTGVSTPKPTPDLGELVEASHTTESYELEVMLKDPQLNISEFGSYKI